MQIGKVFGHRALFKIYVQKLSGFLDSRFLMEMEEYTSAPRNWSIGKDPSYRMQGTRCKIQDMSKGIQYPRCRILTQNSGYRLKDTGSKMRDFDSRMVPCP
ncbi:MAG: hypothetical protein CVU64_09965 [Deltaproteobacteria bacterium HGW-Deltaproteobacteria-21]|nr:MAG: hypothetical protein CVU64_09965 [Deltaproteobacteria bacterium HGW-Deltaproteobacteria-21]